MSSDTTTTSGARREVRHLAASALGMSERTRIEVRRVAGSLTDRIQLQLRAWFLALDPETRVWIEEAKRAVEDGTSPANAIGRDEALRTLEELRKQA